MLLNVVNGNAYDDSKHHTLVLNLNQRMYLMNA